VKGESRQRRADLVERSALCERPKINGNEASVIDQVGHDLLGTCMIGLLPLMFSDIALLKRFPCSRSI
jgi:hypothetical protein